MPPLFGMALMLAALGGAWYREGDKKLSFKKPAPGPKPDAGPQP
jgi:hypothetical protein